MIKIVLVLLYHHQNAILKLVSQIAEKNQQENQVLYMVIKEHFYQQEK